jgi:hypothetical protein
VNEAPSVSKTRCCQPGSVRHHTAQHRGRNYSTCRWLYPRSTIG